MIAACFPPHEENMALLYTGWLLAPSGGWTLALSSDDGSRLYVDGAEVIDNSGAQGQAARRSPAAAGN